MKKTKYVTIESPGKIPVLGGILGPITSPSYLDVSIIISLINSGKAVYEVNPNNTKEKVRLNRMNVLRDNFDRSYTKPVNNVVKASDVGIPSSVIEPSTTQTTIIPETGEGMVGVDIFTSNKYS